MQLQKKTGQVKPWDFLTFYNPGEARQPLIKWTEWTEQRAISALEQAGLINSGGADSVSGTSPVPFSRFSVCAVRSFVV